MVLLVAQVFPFSSYAIFGRMSILRPKSNSTSSQLLNLPLLLQFQMLGKPSDPMREGGLIQRMLNGAGPLIPGLSVAAQL